MKKIFATMALAAAMFAFVACQSPADKAKEYAEDIAAAYAEGDYEKAAALEAECAEWMSTLSLEELAEIAKEADLDF